MPKCSFSGEQIVPGTGIMYVLKEGKILYFKNSKCMKNYLKLKRNPRDVRWTAIHRAIVKSQKESPKESSNEE